MGRGVRVCRRRLVVPCIEDVPQQNHHDDHKNDLEDG